MRTSDFNFELPPQLIAQAPASERSQSRLLCMDGNTAELSDHIFHELPDLLQSNDLIIFNDTRVMKARMFGEKETGGKIEVLVERLVDDFHVLAQVRASKSPKNGSILRMCDDQFDFEVINREGEFYRLRSLDVRPVVELLELYGALPLPPYITHSPDDNDETRYQTVFARQIGAVAAPTAGLHFDEALLVRIADKGIRSAHVTLHVGAGTFQPVRSENLNEHKMHSEWFDVPLATVKAIHETRRLGGKVIAVGTTAMRALESAARSGEIEAGQGDTNIFITPGYQFKVVDRLITNFHLPRTTLLMLVSAFAGREQILNAYQHAIDQQYRFFSYGDAMLLTRKEAN